MKCLLLHGLISLTLVLFAWSPATPAAELPPLVVPEGLGVNIHFTDARPGEMAMLAAAGFRWIRMDFAWSAIEREPGKYDFSAYDRLLAEMEKHQLRGLWILDYSHPRYDDNLSPHSDAGRQAFARWAAAAVVHFRGHGILWEMYNEPNLDGFWRPQVNREAYAKLALTVGQALREAASEELYIGPATSGIDPKFLETCFQRGLLDYWQAVSVHPYRQTAPETVLPDYELIRQLIARHAPQGKSIPILAGEWGYSSIWKDWNEAQQGKALVRQYLTNLACGVPLTIWYDWHDDGQDPKEKEHHFGIVAFPYHEGRDPVYDPKPAYTAARTLTTVLNGFAFQKRLSLGDEKAMALAFTQGEETRWAVWTTGDAQPLTLTLPAGRYQVTDHLGQAQPPLTATAEGLVLTPGDAPLYLVREK